MMDHSELVKRLRAQGRLEGYYEAPAIQREAANALEAQAKRIAEIAELEHRVEFYEKNRDLALKVAAERHDRIAELEAALKESEQTLTVASRILSKDTKIVSKGRLWGKSTLETIRAVLANTPASESTPVAELDCVDPNGVPFSKLTGFVDRAWARKTINEKDQRITKLEAENAKLRTLLLNLADAADGVGIKHFDTDSFSDEVEEMRLSTLAAREELKKPAQL